MIYVIATTQVKPENTDDFIKGHKECIAETLQGEGLHRPMKATPA